MTDLSKVQNFQWDAGNARKSVDKHNVSQSEAEQIFFNEPLLLVDDEQHSLTEPRFHAIGHNDDNRALHITFTLRYPEPSKRGISARDMHRNERRRYDHET